MNDHRCDATDGSVLLEMVRIGSYLRVAALDPATATEVSVIGPATQGEAALRRLAAAKLARAVARRRTGRDG
jgi:hypothetical protein